jgi:hypothetical protein
MSPLNKYEDIILKLGLLGSGLLCIASATRLWEDGNMGVVPVSMVLSLLYYVAGFTTIVIAARRSINKRMLWLIPEILLLVFVSRFHLFQLQLSFVGSEMGYTDGVSFYN